MTGDVRDERLNAYIDGELQGDDLALLEQQLAADSALRTRVEQLRSVDRTLAAAFSHPDLATVPSRFQAILNAPPADNVVTLFPRKAAAWQLPIAAGLALAIGVAGGFLTGRSADTQTPSVIAALAEGVGPRDSLHRLLSATPSADRRTQGNVVFEPVLTFEAADGRFCREFEITAGAEAAVGVACKSGEEWRLEVLTASAAIDGSGYAPVSGPDALIDGAMERLGAKPPLSPEAEAALMQKGWR